MERRQGRFSEPSQWSRNLYPSNTERRWWFLQRKTRDLILHPSCSVSSPEAPPLLSLICVFLGPTWSLKIRPGASYKRPHWAGGIFRDSLKSGESLPADSQRALTQLRPCFQPLSARPREQMTGELNHIYHKSEYEHTRTDQQVQK